jgi:hypothetical protein
MPSALELQPHGYANQTMLNTLQSTFNRRTAKFWHCTFRPSNPVKLKPRVPERINRRHRTFASGPATTNRRSLARYDCAQGRRNLRLCASIGNRAGRGIWLRTFPLRMFLGSVTGATFTFHHDGHHLPDFFADGGSEVAAD